MIVGMRIGSTGTDQKSGANMRMGAEKVELVPTPTPKDEVKEEKPLAEIKAKAEAKASPDKEAIKPAKESQWGPLNSLTIAKLEKAGYSSIQGLKEFSKAELLEIKGVGEKVAEQILSYNTPK